MQEYKVIREHTGDKDYEVGDTRTARRADVAHLMGKCLEAKRKKPTKAKAEKPLLNKAAK